VYGLGFLGSGLRIQGLGVRVEGLGFRIQGAVLSLGFKGRSLFLRVQIPGFRVHSVRVQGV
jgi:hypothetical protein